MIVQSNEIHVKIVHICFLPHIIRFLALCSYILNRNERGNFPVHIFWIYRTQDSTHIWEGVQFEWKMAQGFLWPISCFTMEILQTPFMGACNNEKFTNLFELLRSSLNFSHWNGNGADSVIKNTLVKFPTYRKYSEIEERASIQTLFEKNIKFRQ